MGRASERDPYLEQYRRYHRFDPSNGILAIIFVAACAWLWWEFF